MTVPHFVALVTRQKVEDLFRLAKQVPPDRLTWRPEGKGRPVLDQLQECALTPVLHLMILGGTLPEITPGWWNEFQRQRERWTTVEQCQEACAANTDRLIEHIQTMTEEDLARRISLPLNGGMDVTFAEVALFHYWNTAYHEGQVSYILSLID
jgi:hypothetical protein